MDIIIIGGGAAGLFCAMTAAARRKSVLILEHNSRLGAKLSISGGGRCNFTNLDVTCNNYHSFDPSFVNTAIEGFTPAHFCKILKKHKIAYVEKERGQLFCTGSASNIVKLLQHDCEDHGVSIMTDCMVSSVAKNSKGEFALQTSNGEFSARSLVLATGGLSYPQIGATNFGFAIAKQFGIKATPLRPALVPLLYDTSHAKKLSALSGISVDGTVKVGTKEYVGAILFTHTGLSGPAILNSSLYWEKGMSITINLAPSCDIERTLSAQKRSGKRSFVHTSLSQVMPRRLAEFVCESTFMAKPISDCSVTEIKKIAHAVHRWQFTPRETAGFGKAEVTAGGIQTRELSDATMESKKVKGLYFVGELVDIAGEVGGYNLHWAWASGYAAGCSA